MASLTATATMLSATGFDKRASSASSLQTPGSGSFPSELVSPLATSPSLLRRDELKTPITPPSAYLDFLRNMSPAMLSPAPSSTSARFSFSDKDLASHPPLEKVSSASPPIQLDPQQPQLSRNTSYDSSISANSSLSSLSGVSIASSTSHGSAKKQRPESPRVIIPPSPFAKPAPRSARTPRLHIPQSPLNPAVNSTHSIPQSPYSTTPLSAAPWSATFSPRDIDPEINGKPGKVSVRQVVTRTVTYCRTPLDPAPKGKRRKIEVEELDSKESSEEPPVKQEKLDDQQAVSATPDAPKDA
ncbi:hypothetical protein BDY17DRAFT_326529 [Neohortaea acidophila]|uniref:Uncharacterized protein n=1 Tax=Neohortaea acidophila TaxID=245834 RepID=A0A6A6PLV3_9PEZI|nr:uncharacterized protein BDY17DRAFT_326529 [Neohortaea acidophila]KAF2480644.1 hypothetical protein BDY17DRAFT_326529 [Neohortaea acidophila]